MSWQDILKADIDGIDQNTKKLIVQEYNRNMKNDIKSHMESKIAQGKIPKITIGVSGRQQDNEMKEGMMGTAYMIGILSHEAMDNANKNVIMQQIAPLLNADGYQTGQGLGVMTVKLSPEKIKQVKANNPTLMRNLSAAVRSKLSRKPKATGQQPIDVEFTETDVQEVNTNTNPKSLTNKKPKLLQG